MLTITAKAAEKMKEALAQEGKADYGLRVIAQAGGCSCCGPAYALYPEREQQPDDTVIEEAGVRFFIDPGSLPLVAGATIDYIEHPEYGAGFMIQNPNVQAPGHGHGHGDNDGDGGCSCGCGCGCGDDCGCSS